jgi:hypothetical protein
MYKTNNEMLLDTNIKRNGDLCDFIHFVDASDVLKERLQDEAAPPTTLFVPTNDALSGIMVGEDVFGDSASSGTLVLLNHVVDGNFATNV